MQKPNSMPVVLEVATKNIFVFFPAVMVIGFFTTLVVRVIDNLAV